MCCFCMFKAKELRRFATESKLYQNEDHTASTFFRGYIINTGRPIGTPVGMGVVIGMSVGSTLVLRMLDMVLLEKDINEGGLGIKPVNFACSRPRKLKDLLQRAKLHQNKDYHASTCF